MAEPEAEWGDGRTREVTNAIEHAVEPYVGIVDWSGKTDVQREMRRQIKRKLPNEVFSRDEQERLAAALIDLLRVRKGK